MNLNKIKEIIEMPLISESDKKNLIVDEISKGEDVVPTILMILNAERERKNELVSNMNLLLSKADLGLKEPKLNEDGFMQKEISEFYDTAEVNHCFKNSKK
tara:strand:- start:1888 stop:2190 length:303 start_codon:yes stop_codon:yes gene_type:complete